MENAVDKAIETFISGCWKKVNDYYKDAICGKNVYIYGSGVYGKFLYNALSHLGYSKQIICFINDYVTSDGEVLFNLPIKKSSNITFNDDDVIVVGIQNCSGVIKKIKDQGLNYIIADYDQSFYQNNLMYTVYQCIDVSDIAYMPGKIKQFYSKFYEASDEILSLYNEEFSRNVIQNRLNFYRTGDVSYIDQIPVNYHQYFQDDYYSISDEEVFVDCGAFDGDTIKQFITFTEGKYKKIIGIEPDTISFKKLREFTQNNPNVTLFCCATGKEKTKLNFSSKGVLGSSFSEEEIGELTDICRLDDLLGSERVSLIKMDIEGAELDSLIGAEQIIKKNKPKIAVCIYHKMGDIITIPKYLHSIVPEYCFKVRQHSQTMLETVLYAEVK